MTETITLTFCDAGENHVCMEMIGDKGIIGSGFNLKDLTNIKKKIEENELFKDKLELIDLRVLIEDTTMNLPEAYLLVIRNGAEYFLRTNACENLFSEMNRFEWDRKYYDTLRKSVLNKPARANVYFDTIGHEPDYENKKGTIISYDKVHNVNMIRTMFGSLIGPKGKI